MQVGSRTLTGRPSDHLKLWFLWSRGHLRCSCDTCSPTRQTPRPPLWLTCAWVLHECPGPVSKSTHSSCTSLRIYLGLSPVPGLQTRGVHPHAEGMVLCALLGSVSAKDPTYTGSQTTMSLGIACDSSPVSLVCHRAVGSCWLTLFRSCWIEFSQRKKSNFKRKLKVITCQKR